MLHIQDLHKTYPGGRRALAGVTLRLADGERLVLLGPNGAGKTTLIKCVMGLVVPDRGQILLGGVDVTRDPAVARRSVAVVFEEADNSYAYLTVRDNLLYFGLLNGWSNAEAETRARELLDLVGLSHRAGDLAQSLSRGMKQKLALAIALTKEAPILFLDEPTLGLDVESQQQMRRLLTATPRGWKAVLVTTHDIPFAHAVGSRFVILKDGRIAWEATRDEAPTPAALEELFLSVTGAHPTGPGPAPGTAEGDR
ncbi:MAG TPA: ABC transporter ATP-binding protein [Thermaerobacter sp.]